MGTDIHSFAEVRQDGTWTRVGAIFPSPYSAGSVAAEPIEDRNYSLFGFLGAWPGGYLGVAALVDPRGLPSDVDLPALARPAIESGGYFGVSWLTLEELAAYDYERVITDPDGDACTLRQLLGDDYFDMLAQLRTIGDPRDVRIVFYFDN